MGLKIVSIKSTPNLPPFSIIISAPFYLHSQVREIRVKSLVDSWQKLKKLVLDVTLLTTQHYKVRMKGKVKQSKEVAPV